MSPPKLVDYSMFKKKVKIEPPKIKEVKKIPVKTNYSFFINSAIILIILIGGYLLYQRYKNKDENKKIYTKKIENLYNTINKYDG
tara:strand:+ start:272 stop:526 length:255 start_codon:yes stop_codon:yes gene_type:complete